MNTVLFENAIIGFSENIFLVIYFSYAKKTYIPGSLTHYFHVKYSVRNSLGLVLSKTFYVSDKRESPSTFKQTHTSHGLF